MRQARVKSVLSKCSTSAAFKVRHYKADRETSERPLSLQDCKSVNRYDNMENQLSGSGLMRIAAYNYLFQLKLVLSNDLVNLLAII